MACYVEGGSAFAQYPEKASDLAPRFVLLYRNVPRDAAFICALQGKEAVNGTRYHSGTKMPEAAQFLLEYDYDFRDNDLKKVATGRGPGTT